jgi:hypothetical protein
MTKEVIINAAIAVLLLIILIISITVDFTSFGIVWAYRIRNMLPFFAGGGVLVFGLSALSAFIKNRNK